VTKVKVVVGDLINTYVWEMWMVI